MLPPGPCAVSVGRQPKRWSLLSVQGIQAPFSGQRPITKSHDKYEAEGKPAVDPLRGAGEPSIRIAEAGTLGEAPVEAGITREQGLGAPFQEGPGRSAHPVATSDQASPCAGSSGALALRTRRRSRRERENATPASRPRIRLRFGSPSRSSDFGSEIRRVPRRSNPDRSSLSPRP